MKILVSVYACNPGKGSEPGVGWNWIRQLSELLPYDEIYALTQSKNRSQTLNAIGISGLKNIKVIDFSFGKNDRLIKKYLGRQIHHFFWQILVFYKLQKEFPRHYFDIVHHLTYVSVFYPVRTYHFGKKFILGPLAGGDTTESKLLNGIPGRYRWKEYIKNIIVSTRFFVPLCYKQFASSENIICTTENTLNLIPKKFKEKTSIFPAIGCDIKANNYSEKELNRIIYCGNFHFWKGIHLVLQAFQIARAINPNLTLLLIGQGNVKTWIQTYLKVNYLEQSVTILDWLPQEKLQKEISKSAVLLFPSLRDSGGMVMLEALAEGTPVVALNLAGPRTILKNRGRFLIETENRNQHQVVSNIADRIIQITSSRTALLEASKAALESAKENTWNYRVNNFLKLYVSQ